VKRSFVPLDRIMPENALKMMEGPWSFTCNICGVNLQREITAKGIADLLSIGYVLIECSECKNKSMASLEDLISAHLTKEHTRFA